MVLRILGVRMVRVPLLMPKVILKVGLKLMTRILDVAPLLGVMVLRVLGVRMVRVLSLMLKAILKVGL